SRDRALVEVIAGASDEDLAYLDWQVRQLFAFSADVEYLERWAAQKGLARKAATKAAGTVTLVGTPNTTAPSGQQLQTAAGVAIVTLADATTDIGGNRYGAGAGGGRGGGGGTRGGGPPAPRAAAAGVSPPTPP